MFKTDMSDPIKIFSEWFEILKAHEHVVEPTAMTLATATKDGKPSARIVLLKHFDEKGFVFYTNMQSRKSEELKENPYAALCFNWIAIGRQVRIEGRVEQATESEADTYFNSRALISRIGAAASNQSRPLDSRDTLMKKVNALQAKYDEQNPPPRPAHWSGWRVVPSAIEFWQEGEFRLHDREVYTSEGNNWKVQRLYP